MGAGCGRVLTEDDIKSIYNEEQQKQNNKMNGASVIKENTKFRDPLDMYEKKGWLGSFKGVVKEIIDYATGEIPKFVDLAKDLWSEEKMTGRWKAIHDRIDWNVRNISGDPRRMEIYRNSLRTSAILTQIAMFSNPETRSLTKLENEHAIIGFKQWSQGRTKDNTLNDYKRFVEETKVSEDKFIANDTLLLEAIKQRNLFAQEMVNKIAKVDPNFAAKMLGGQEAHDHMSVAFAVMARAFSMQDKGVVDKIYNRLYALNIQGALEAPQFFEHNMHQLLDAHYNSLRFHNEMMKGNANKELIELLTQNASNVKPLTLAEMRKLEPGNPLKTAIDDIDTRLLNDPELQTFVKNSIAKGDVNIIIDALEKKALLETRKASGAFNDTTRRVIKNNKEIFPNIYDAVFNNKLNNVSDIMAEADVLNKQYGENLQMNAEKLHSAQMWFELGKDFKSKIDNHGVEVSTNFMRDIASQFPNHVLVTSSGTQLFSRSGRFQDLEHNGDMIGHIADLTNPELLLDDAIYINKIKSVGDKAIIDMINSGQVTLIPKEQAKMLASAKKAALPPAERRTILGKINGMFSVNQLFGPTRFLSYAQQQIFGNIGSTIAANPAAFKHWPKAIKALTEFMKNGKNTNAITDPEMRKIMTYLFTSEGGGLHQLTLDNLKIFGDENFKKELDALSVDPTATGVTKFYRKWLAGMGNVSSIIENISRGALAYHTLQGWKAGKLYVPLTANGKRVADLWDIDPELAAVRISNDAHVDYKNLPPTIKHLTKNMPFFSYTIGAALNYLRSFVGLGRSYRDAFRGEGSWSLAGKHTVLTAASLIFRLGAMAFLVNSIWKMLGLLPEDQEEKMRNSKDKNLIQSLFGMGGMDTHLWSAMYIPGTGSKTINDFFGWGKTTNQYDQFKGVEQLVPYATERWYQKGDDGQMESPFKIGAETYVSMMSPGIKIPVELAMGGGTLMSDGYISPRAGQGEIQTITEKISTIFGANTMTRDLFNAWHGNDNVIKSTNAAYHQEIMSQMNNIKYAETPANDLNKQLGYAIKDMNVNQTHDIIAKLEQQYQSQGLTQNEIGDKMRSTFDHNSIAGSINGKQYQSWLNGMSSDDYSKLQKALNVESDFKNAIGYNYW